MGKRFAVYIEGLEVDGATNVVTFYRDDKVGMCLLTKLETVADVTFEKLLISLCADTSKRKLLRYVGAFEEVRREGSTGRETL